MRVCGDAGGSRDGSGVPGAMLGDAGHGQWAEAGVDAGVGCRHR